MRKFGENTGKTRRKSGKKPQRVPKTEIAKTARFLPTTLAHDFGVDPCEWQVKHRKGSTQKTNQNDSIM